MEFNREPGLELQTAITIKQLAETFNEIPDYVNETTRRNITLNGGYRLELRDSHHTSPEPEFDLPDSRYIYFFRDYDNSQPNSSDHNKLKRSILAFDIFDFNDDSLSGLSRAEPDLELLELIAADNQDAENDIVALLDNSIKAFTGMVVEQKPGDELTAQLSDNFKKLVREGSHVKMNSSSVNLGHNVKLSVEQTIINGSLEHVWLSEFKRPHLKVTLKTANKKLIFEQNQAGTLESYTANVAEDTAAGMDPANVVLNEEGQIILVKVNIAAQDLFESAQRAIGLRQLKMEVLDPIHTALKAVTFNY